MSKENPTLRDKTRIGLFWGIGNQLTKQVFSFLMTILLIRLLIPEDFGLIAMVLVFSSFSTILIDFGFSTSIIQNQQLKTNDLSSIFWINLMIGTLLASLLYVLAPYIADLYHEPRLITITRVISILYIILSMYIVPKALLSKELDFKSITITESGSIIISGIVAIVVAILGYGVWALVMQIITKHIVAMVIYWYRSNWLPKLVFQWAPIKKIGRFSSSVFYSSVLYYLSVNVDRFLIGRYIGADSVGLYDKSYSLAGMPRRNMSQLILSLLFSSFAKIQEEPERIRRVYLQAMRMVALINFPIMVGILVSTESFVLTIFGEKWVSMIPYLQIFSIVLIFNSFSTLLGSIMLARGLSKMVLRDATIRQGIIIFATIIGIANGSIGVAYGILAASVFNFVLTISHAKIAAYVAPRTQLMNIKTIAIGASLMGIVIFLLQNPLGTYLSEAWLLAANVFIGLILFFGYLTWKKDPTFSELYQLMTNK